jgi:hypothetical protein
MADDDTKSILEALDGLGASLTHGIDGIINRVDRFAESTQASFARIEACLDRIETGLRAAETDLIAARVEAAAR